MTSARHHARTALWALLAVPGLCQLGLLLYTVARRFAYPYDLEWMEGGMLAHAARLAEGQSIYPPPSIEFIPYLYTPLYPALLAGLGSVTGISYQLGRAVSVAAILAVCALMVVALRRAARPAPGRAGAHGDGGDASDDSDDEQAPAVRDLRLPAWCGAAVAAGFFAATYPWVEGWYDIARADTLFLAMILGGLVLLERQARRGQGWRGQLGVAGAAALLAVSFFCKQTGVFYVAVGGALLLAWNPRRVPVYVLTAGVIGLGGTAVLTRVTDGWFWTYAFEVHQAHDFNIDRFYMSFGNILGRHPAMTAAVALGLLAVGVTALGRRVRPAGAGPLLVWSFVFAASCVVGAIGWGTQWAHFNAYMPAMMTGGLAAGASLPALAGCARVWASGSAAASAPRRAWAVHAAPAIMAALLGLDLALSLWSPRPFVPEPRDQAAGQALIEHLRGLREGGDIYVPFHPWYARMAGQDAFYAHRMGIMDLSYGNAWQVAGAREAFRDHRFAAVILDNRPPGWELPDLAQHYRPEERIPESMRPRLFTGARVVPDMVWVPIDTAVPPGARMLFDFEQGHLRGWDIEGTAWSKRPVRGPVRGQGPVPDRVSRWRGRYFVTSMHGGDRATGMLTSPSFRITGGRLTFRMAGGRDPSLRIELVIADGTSAGKPMHTATSDIDGERMREVSWDVRPFQGQEARLVLVDQATGAWGHMSADDFLLWPE
jgi:hypothetical protein